MSIQACKEALQAALPDYLLNSGRFIQQMGLYQPCDQMANGNYYLVDFINNITKLDTNVFIGLCMPNECTEDIVTNAVNDIIIQLGNALPLPLAVEKVNINPQDFRYEKTWLFYFLLTLIIMFTVLGLVAFLVSRKKRAHPSLGIKMLDTFNYEQTFKIFIYKSNPLNVFNGIKTICMLWVIFGHQFSVRLKNDVNILSIPGQVEKFFYLFVIGSFLAVDVFFFIGGFLVAYSFMRQKSKSILKYPFAILHRVLRFWPSYLMTIGIYYAVYIHTGDGPFWRQNWTLGQIPYCGNIWKTIFFLDNIIDNGEQMCLGWGWYLQNDMQIFIVSLVFILLYTKHRLAGYISLIIITVFSLGLNVYEAQVNEYVHVTHLVDFAKWSRYFPDIYIKPWIRCPPYIIGLVLGLLHMEYLEVERKEKQRVRNSKDNEESETMHQNKNFFYNLKRKLEKSKVLLYTFQIVGFILIAFVVLIPRTLQVGNKWPQIIHSLFLSFSKVIFVAGLYIMILPSLLSVKNITFFLLDTKFFNFTSKISFWTYLIHFMVVEQVSYSQKVDFYYSPLTVIPLYVSIAFMATVLGFIGTIIVEVPFSKQEKMLFSQLMKLMGKKKSSDSILAQGKQSLMSESLLKNSSITDSIKVGGINASIKE